ncbi:MAG: D-2-hydroxyacid dehydrogenase [Terriglobales bacterium]
MKLLAIVPDDLPSLRLLRHLGRGVEVVIGHTPEVIAREAPAAEVILYSSLAGGTPPFRDVWPHTGPGLRWVHSFEAGLDRLLTPELTASQVLVSNARGVYAPPLAEFAVFGILFFYKQTRRMLAQQAARRWEQFEVEGLAGKVMAVAGYGGVGSACAQAARRLGMRIHALRRHPDRRERGVEHMFAPAELHAMLAGADVVLAAAPLTPETRHLLNAAAFAAMKPTALLINVGRGPVVEEAALVDALRQHRIAGAALDVFEHEPLLPESPLWALDNLLLSPHCTDRTIDPHWTEVGMRCFLQNWRRWRRGRPLLTPVDKAAGY